MTKCKISKTQKIIDAIEPIEALKILKLLSENDRTLAKQIEKLFLEQVQKIDMEDIAVDVLAELDFIDVEDLWERSGSTRDGYIEPGEEAWAMLEEAIGPYIEKMKRYHSLKMFEEEMACCMGLISALHQFENESESEFKEWAVDAPLSIADDVLSTWKESCKDPELRQTMENFIAKLS